MVRLRRGFLAVDTFLVVRQDATKNVYNNSFLSTISSNFARDCCSVCKQTPTIKLSHERKALVILLSRGFSNSARALLWTCPFTSLRKKQSRNVESKYLLCWCRKRLNLVNSFVQERSN
jgi:hypothetical protein